MTETFAHVLKRAKGGHPEAIGALLAPEMPRIAAFVRNRLAADVARRESPSDVVQSVCRDVIRDLDRVEAEEETGFRAWVFRVARNKLTNKHKFHRAACRDVERDEHTTHHARASRAAAALAPSPRHRAAAEEDAARIEAAFARLPDDYRAVILHVCMTGLSYREAGELMDRSEHSVRKLVHRARAELATLLDRS